MRTLKEHNNIMRMGKFPYMMSISEVKEIHDAIWFVSYCIFFYMAVIISKPFLTALALSSAVHFSLNSCVALLDTLATRRYRIGQSRETELLRTLDKLAINESRKAHGSKISF